MSPEAEELSEVLCPVRVTVVEWMRRVNMSDTGLGDSW